MNTQDVLIRLLKADQITEEEFKVLYELTTRSNELQIQPSFPWDSPPIVTFGQQEDKKITTPWPDHSGLKVMRSGSVTDQTISASNSREFNLGHGHQ